MPRKQQPQPHDHGCVSGICWSSHVDQTLPSACSPLIQECLCRYLAPLVPAASGPSKLGKSFSSLSKKAGKGLVAGSRPSLKRSKSMDLKARDMRAQAGACECSAGGSSTMCCMYHTK